MNSLQQYIHYNGIDEVKAMNALQDHGIVSDNCVHASEVKDSGKAVAWLNENLWKYEF